MNKFFSLYMVCFAFVFMFSATLYAKEITGQINPNQANAQQLMMLPGVGEAKAKSIIESRSVKAFISLEDLKAIKGIGDKMIAKWKPHLVFKGETTISYKEEHKGE